MQRQLSGNRGLAIVFSLAAAQCPHAPMRETDMQTKILILTLTGAAVVATGSALAYRTLVQDDGYAEVVSVTPVNRDVQVPREVCTDEVVTRQYREQGHPVAATAIGALVGGAVGNQVGGGSGRRAATAAGAIAGGVIGHQVQERRRGVRTVQDVERRCRTVTDTVQEHDGFEVVYRYRGEQASVRMDHDPGLRLAMRSRSEPVIAPDQAPSTPQPQ
jgi:uncharacterized protein YcfJ